MSPPGRAEARERRRQLVEPHLALDAVDELELVGSGPRRAGLVGDLGVDAAVDVVLDRLHDPHVLDGERRARGAHEREQAHDVVEALEVDGVGAAALVDSRRHHLVVEQLHDVGRELLARHGDLEVEVAARVGDETARHEGPAQVGRATAGLGNHARVHTGGEAAPRHEDAHAHERLLEALLLGNLDEVVACLVQVGATHRE